jgi:hypothetical protein
LRVLKTDVENLDEGEKIHLYGLLGANRFDEKYNHDKLASLCWAILEEKRRNVRMLVNKVLVVKDLNGGQRIALQNVYRTDQRYG